MNLIASNKNEAVKLADKAAVGMHKAGGTCVKETVCGRYAVVQSIPRRDGTLRLIKLLNDQWHARRYNWAIHGDKTGSVAGCEHRRSGVMAEP